MKPLFKCEFNYFPSRHLSYIYDGFERLRKIGLIDVKINRLSLKQVKPVLNVQIDGKYNVVYDTLDGLNWIDGSIEENLNYFENEIKADFYFKRSFNNEIIDHAPKNCKVYPLGLNVPFRPEGKYPETLQYKFKKILKDNYFISKYYKKTSFCRRDLEYYPLPNKEHKILFLTQLWNPYESKLGHLKEERLLINANRIRCIKALRKEFGKMFVGGLQYNSYLGSNSESLLMPLSMTNRENFLKIIKEHNICIATTGLHSSIGSKFGEYVAASRAIVTEPLNYELPGDFENKKNYLMFYNEHELIENIHHLLKHDEKLNNMMENNFHYYNNYVRSDSLVLNSLLRIVENIS
jgi:hypothetical protein